MARSSSDVDAARITAAKARVGAQAAASLAAAGDLTQRAATLLAAPVALRESARHQTQLLNAEAVHVRLRSTPISSLQARGARLGPLERAGFRTVVDVLAAPQHVLQAVPGVGPQTVQNVIAAARSAQARMHGDTRFRFDPDRPEAAQTQLLATLAAIRAADSTVATLRGELEMFVRQTGPLLVAADRTRARISMWFASRAKKDAALRALAEVDAVLADPRVTALRQTITQRERAVDPNAYPPEQLWRDYLADAAAVNAVLSTVGGDRQDDVEAAGGFVPEELRQQITAIPLDTSLLTVTLRGYQVFGAQYAIHQERSILGDEMGLGKTVQALAVLAHLAAKGQRRFLVVCPASVQINWLNETAKHSRLEAYSLHGTDRSAAARRWLRDGGVAVTTFGTLGKLLPEVRSSEVAMLVVDEAHYVKNPDAARSATVRKVLESAQRGLFLTGTPMENRVEEFRALVEYLQPRIAERIDASDAVAGARVFRRTVAPVYLRRNQEDVLTELPGKIEVEDWVQLSSGDQAAYKGAVRSRNLMGMRRAAFRSADSAKLGRLAEIVGEAGEDGMKVVVFSYFLGVLDAVGDRLGPAVLGTITGAVPPTQRQQIVDDFRSHHGHAVLLAQIEAGGVGINMQAASVVVITEPQWKPSTEDQAVARAHRMGQVRTVQVHRLLAKDSVDERMQEIQHGKKLLFDEFARKSEAKDADARAVDADEHRPPVLDDESVPLERRIILAEEHRLGVDDSP